MSDETTQASLTHLNRREFIRNSAIGLGAIAALPAESLATRAAGARDAERLKKIGIQLYTVRDEMKKGVEATLKRIASIGYNEVEFAGYFDKTPAQIAELLKANGLRSPSAHISLDIIRGSWPKMLDDAAQVGHEFLVCAYIDEKQRTLDSYNRIADDFNKAAEQAKAHKISFAYHNHDFEFIKAGDVVPYDLLLSKCDSKLVLMEMDLFWMNKANQDPLAYFAKYPGRFPMVHVKDMSASGEIVDVGDGKLPFAKYFAQSKQAGIKHYFVERDNPTDAFATAATSLNYLKKLEF